MMKNWTKKFLGKRAMFPCVNHKENGERLNKQTRFPEKLWSELSTEIKESELIESVYDLCREHPAYIQEIINSTFMAGVAVGWVEKPENCKFSVVVPEITLSGVIEIIPCTISALKNISQVKIWKS
jgi:hypothetical protein